MLFRYTRLAAFLFGIVLLMKQSLYPVFTVLKDLAFEPEAGLVAWGGAALWALGCVAVSFAVAVAIALAFLWLFDRLTREIKELEEIRKDNVAVAIFFSGVFLSMAYFMEAGLHGLLVTLIPVMGIRLPWDVVVAKQKRAPGFIGSAILAVAIAASLWRCGMGLQLPGR
ncbi:MAG: DUF350 domain-containing protein [Spirochaetia bacterium]|nr:DUF350 domain-containing protein [Spirochaetia bacterium]